MSMVLGQTFANPASFSIGLIHPDSPAGGDLIGVKHVTAGISRPGGSTL